VDPGFEPSGVLTASIPRTPDPTREPASDAAFCAERVRRVPAAPGGRSAAVVSQLPLGGGIYAGGFSVRERPELADSEGLVADRRVASPGYFATMRIPVRAGRAFEARDGVDAPGVAVVSETFANRYLGERALGSHVKLGGADSKRPWLEV